jgi:hypothetical protein
MELALSRPNHSGEVHGAVPADRERRFDLTDPTPDWARRRVRRVALFRDRAI